MQRIHLGEYLRRLREQRGLSAQEVARQVFGLEHAHTTVRRIERGCPQQLSLHRLSRLLSFYEVDGIETLKRAAQGPLLRDNPGQSRCGYRLAQVRLALDLTCTQFARLAGLPGAHADKLVERWEAGEVEPSPEDLQWLLEGLGDSVDATWLRGLQLND